MVLCLECRGDVCQCVETKNMSKENQAENIVLVNNSTEKIFIEKKLQEESDSVNESDSVEDILEKKYSKRIIKKCMVDESGLESNPDFVLDKDIILKDSGDDQTNLVTPITIEKKSDIVPENHPIEDPNVDNVVKDLSVDNNQITTITVEKCSQINLDPPVKKSSDNFNTGKEIVENLSLVKDPVEAYDNEKDYETTITVEMYSDRAGVKDSNIAIENNPDITIKKNSKSVVVRKPIESPIKEVHNVDIAAENHTDIVESHSETSLPKYECKICGVCCEKILHPTEPTCQKLYECELCQNCFTWKLSLRCKIPTYFNQSGTVENKTQENNCFEDIEFKKRNECSKVKGKEITKCNKKSNTQLLFECKKCKVDFRHLIDLKNHICMGIVEHLYKCEKCGNYFRRETQLKKHICSRTSYKCEMCGKQFKKETELAKHRCINLDDKPDACKTEEISFQSKYNLRSSKNTSHTEKHMYNCTVCRKCFKNQYLLSKHTLLHTQSTCLEKQVTSESTYACEICGEVFSSNSECSTHMRIHEEVNLYKCGQCKETFLMRNKWLKHIRSHPTPMSRGQNDIIINRTSQSSLLKCQQNKSLEKPLGQSHKVVSKTKYICNTCGAQFSLKKALKLHMRTHKAYKIYKCEYCQESFSVQGKWLKHITNHDPTIINDTNNDRQCTSLISNHQREETINLTETPKRICSPATTITIDKHIADSSLLLQHHSKNASNFTKAQSTSSSPNCICTTATDMKDNKNVAVSSLLLHHRKDIPNSPKTPMYSSTPKHIRILNTTITDDKYVAGESLLLQHHRKKSPNLTKTPKTTSTIKHIRVPGTSIANNKYVAGSSLLLQHHKIKSPNLTETPKTTSTIKHIRVPDTSITSDRYVAGSSLLLQHYRERTPNLTKTPKTTSTIKHIRVPDTSITNGRYVAGSSLLLQHHRKQTLNCTETQNIGSSEKRICTPDAITTNDKHFAGSSLLLHHKKGTSNFIEHNNRSHDADIDMLELEDLADNSNKDKYECQICPDMFSSEKEWIIHMRSHRSLHSCRLCRETFSTRSKLVSHTCIHINDMDQNQVNTSETSRSLLSKLKKNVTGNKHYDCKFCGIHFLHNYDLRSHINSLHTDEKPYKCNVCGKCFPFKSRLDMHALMHTRLEHDHLSKNSYECETCGLLFTSRRKWCSHMQIHREIKLYKCEHCKDTFLSKRKWLKHIAIHKIYVAPCQDHNTSMTHSNEHNKSLLIQNCLNKTFDFKEDSVNETDDDDGEICELTCQVDDSLEDDSNFVCLGDNSGLSTENPYKCTVCGLSFQQKVYLAKHNLTHISNKYECQICRLGFSVKKAYNVHMRLHRKKKLHECAHCGETFSAQINWLNHLRRQHKSNDQDSDINPKHSDKKDDSRTKFVYIYK